MSKHKTVPKKIRKQVFNKYDGHCAYCGCKLTLKEMQVDHMYSVYHAELNKNEEAVSVDDLEDVKGNVKYLREKASHVDDIENLMPACRQCNFYKGAMDLEFFRHALETTLYTNTIKPFQFRLAEKYDLVKKSPHKILFYFEKVDNKTNDTDTNANLRSKKVVFCHECKKYQTGWCPMASIDYETGFADENDQSDPDGWCWQGEYDPHWNDDYNEDDDIY